MSSKKCTKCPGFDVIPPFISTGQVGVFFSQNFTTDSCVNNPIFSTNSMLPAGLNLFPNGVLSGTPTQSGTFPIIVSTTGAHCCTAQSPETPVAMLSPGKGKVHQPYMWVIVGGTSANPVYRIYDFQTSRCHHHAARMLVGYREVLHSDKYGAYESLANQKLLIWCPCWVHIQGFKSDQNSRNCFND